MSCNAVASVRTSTRTSRTHICMVRAFVPQHRTYVTPRLATRNRVVSYVHTRVYYSILDGGSGERSCV